MTRIALASLLTLCACDSGDRPDATAKPAEKAAPAKKAEAKPATEAPAEAPGPAKAELGQPAPDFELTDLDGNAVKLSDHAGKTVVLEWFNPQCPFVKYAHGEGPLRTLARERRDSGVVWLGINSGAPGKQGHGVEVNRTAAKEFSLDHPILMDEDGTVGKQYGAKTTPHMFVIDPNGKLVFRGGVDNAPMGEAEGEPRPYLVEALDELAAGKPIADADVRAYGCSVKYGT